MYCQKDGKTYWVRIDTLEKIELKSSSLFERLIEG